MLKGINCASERYTPSQDQTKGTWAFWKVESGPSTIFLALSSEVYPLLFQGSRKEL